MPAYLATQLYIETILYEAIHQWQVVEDNQFVCWIDDNDTISLTTPLVRTEDVYVLAPCLTSFLAFFLVL